MTDTSPSVAAGPRQIARATVWRTVSVTALCDWVNVFTETVGEHSGLFFHEPAPALLLQESTYDTVTFAVGRRDCDVPNLRVVREFHADESPLQRVVFATFNRLNSSEVGIAAEYESYVESVSWRDWQRRYVDRGRAVPDDEEE
jgi:hypothetical protein